MRTKNIPINEEERPLDIDIWEKKGSGLWKKAFYGETNGFEPELMNLGSFIFLFDED